MNWGRYKSFNKDIINRALQYFGYEIRSLSIETELPALYNNPFDVIEKINAGENIALNCEVQRCVIYNGLSMAAAGWHPFIEAAKEYVNTPVSKYEDSILARYYKSWQPKNAREALIGVKSDKCQFENYSPLLTFNLPWIDASLDSSLLKLCKIINLENSWSGHSELTYLDGYGLQGPVSNEKGKLEYKRLIKVLGSIQKTGYKRDSDDITIHILKRDDDYRYLVLHGQHRVAVMAALGQEYIPAIPRIIVDSQYAEHWPKVYKGIWTHEQAIQYFNHLFDFDSKKWARELKLK